MKKHILFAGASLLAIAALTTTASAADLPSRMQAPVLAAPPVFTWTGFYLGSTVGGLALQSKYTSDYYDYVPEMKATTSTVTLGGTIGYNYQIANIVLGLEADYNWANLNSEHLYDDAEKTARTKMSGFGTVRGRLGLAMDRSLFYVTGGWAFANLKSSAGYADEYPSEYDANVKFNSGWVIGTGVEYAIAPHMTIKLEGLYMDFGKKSGLDGCSCARGFKHTATVGRVGLNYKF